MEIMVQDGHFINCGDACDVHVWVDYYNDNMLLQEGILSPGVTGGL